MEGVMGRIRGVGVCLAASGIAVAQALAPSAGRAASAAQAPPPAARSSRDIECRCRADGRTYELGARVCLRTPSGYRVAECRMVQNVTSWSFGAEGDCSVSASLAASVAAGNPVRPRPR
jgi:hypothetical protein